MFKLKQADLSSSICTVQTPRYPSFLYLPASPWPSDVADVYSSGAVWLIQQSGFMQLLHTVQDKEETEERESV